MACFHPLNGWRSYGGGISFSRSQSIGIPMQVPCGQCIGCRLERSRQWAMRCMHEAALNADNCFLTLTYDDEHLPPLGTLVKSDFQKFMKRLRKNVSPRRFKFFHCGEYGEVTRRPHYHALLFGYDFPDKEVVQSGKDYPEWVSPSLEKVWGCGRTLLGSVTFESAAYVARYCVEPLSRLRYRQGDREDFVRAQDELYRRLDPATGELVAVQREYTTMSRGGRSGRGIGFDWYEKYGSEVFPSDEVIVRGKRMRPPRYYDECIKRDSPVAFKDVSASRRRRRLSVEERRPERLAVKEVCADARLNLFTRGVV